MEDLNAGRGHVDFKKALPQLGGTISRMTFLPELTTAFSLTGNPAYLHKAKELLYAFVEQFPFVLSDIFFEDHDREFGGPANNTLCVVYRACRWLDFMYSGALQIPEIMSDEDVVWLVKQLWFYAMQCYRFCGDILRRDNHHLVDHGHGPLVLGIMFPEFSISRSLISSGRKVLRHHCQHNLFADGAYAEHSNKYQYHIIYHYLHPPAVAMANKIELLSPQQMQRIRKWVGFNTDSTKPDGIQVEIGDAYGGSPAFLFSSLAVPVMNAGLRARIQALGYAPGRPNQTSAAALARQLKQLAPGTAPRIGLSSWYDPDSGPKAAKSADPPGKAAQYPQGGYTFFRESWKPEADYLAVSHFTDSMPHGHAHWDPMSFVLHTGGRTLIGDPATWLYSNSRYFEDPQQRQEQRGYLYNMQSHNCLIMDEDTLKPLRTTGHECFWGGYPPRHGLGLFKTGGPIEVSEVWHDAYTPTRHRRFIIHMRGTGFVFIDMLSRPGLDLRPHQYSQRLHFEFGVKTPSDAPKAGQSMRAAAGKAACLILPGRETDTQWLMWKDEWLEGIFNYSGSTAAPSVAELTRVVQGPAVFSTFFLTGKQSKQPDLTYLGARPGKARVQQHDGFSAHRLDLGSGEALLTAACPYGQALDSPELATDAELAVIRLNARGQVRNWCLARGTYLRAKKTTLYKGRRCEWKEGSA